MQDGGYGGSSARDQAYARKQALRRARQENPPPAPQLPSWVAPAAPNTLLPGLGNDINRQMHKESYHQQMQHTSIKQQPQPPPMQYQQPPPTHYAPTTQQHYPAQAPSMHHQQPQQYYQTSTFQQHQPPTPQFLTQFQAPALQYPPPQSTAQYPPREPPAAYKMPPGHFAHDDIDGAKPRRRQPQVRSHAGQSSADHFGGGAGMVPDVGHKCIGHLYDPRHAGRTSASNAREYFGAEHHPSTQHHPSDALDYLMADHRSNAAPPSMPLSSQGHGSGGGAPPPMRMWQQRQVLEARAAERQAAPLQGEQPAYRLWQQRQDNRHHHQLNHVDGARGVVRAPWE